MSCFLCSAWLTAVWCLVVMYVCESCYRRDGRSMSFQDRGLSNEKVCPQFGHSTLQNNWGDTVRTGPITVLSEKAYGK